MTSDTAVTQLTRLIGDRLRALGEEFDADHLESEIRDGIAKAQRDAMLEAQSAYYESADTAYKKEDHVGGAVGMMVGDAFGREAEKYKTKLAEWNRDKAEKSEPAAFDLDGDTDEQPVVPQAEGSWTTADEFI